MARCSIKLLGSMQILLDGKQLQGLESAKVRALFAYLVVESSQAHARESLAGLFWPEMSESQARHGLSQSLYNLRQVMGKASSPVNSPEELSSSAPLLLITPHTVQLNPQGEWEADVQRFSQGITRVRQHAHRRLETCSSCAQELHQVEQLYQGEFLAGMSIKSCQAFEEWLLIWQERLYRQMCGALADLTAYHTGRAEVRIALELSRRWARLDPLSEPAQRSLMRLLALDGQRAQALAQYTGFRRQLNADLEVEPALETQHLYQRVIDEETTQFSLPGMPGKLPVPLTPFIGREEELSKLTAWLCDPQTRLVTVLGPGGSGKTRLALQAARALRYDFPDGIYLVSLSGLSSSEAFLPALASSLGVVIQHNWGDPLEQLLGYLQHRRLLVILDSFEEMSQASQWVTSLLQAAPGVQLLVTTRARLNIQAEHIFQLEGLQFPAPESINTTLFNLEDYSALKLFRSAAWQVRPDYGHTPADLSHLVRICQLVNGMPLGLVLAAGWLASLTPAEIAWEIERSLDFLSSDWSDLPPRQRSLRATLDHSWHLLSESERSAFQKLSVFQGTFTRQAASRVAGVEAAALRLLADKSMLQVSSGSYRMHDLLRQYGAEKRADNGPVDCQVRDAHSTYFLELLSERADRLKSAKRSATLNEMDTEISDLQAAWKWACTQAEFPLLSGSLEGLTLYYEMRVRYKEGNQACMEGLSAIPDQVGTPLEAQVLRARLLLLQANFLVLSGSLETARQLQQQAGALLDQLEAQGADVRRPRARYWVLEGEAQTELKVKLACNQRGIQLYQSLGEPWRQAELLIWAGEHAIRLGDAALALQYQQEALQLARQLGEPNLLLHSLRQITFLNFVLNRFETANQLIQETKAVLENLEELPLRATAEMYLGSTLVWNGLFPEAIQILDGILPVLRNLGYRFGTAFGSMALAMALFLHGEYPRSEALLRALIPETEQGSFPREAAIDLVILGMDILAQGHLAEAIQYIQDSVSRYRQMQFTGEVGLVLGGLALAQFANGQMEAAKALLIEALQIAQKTHNMLALTFSIPAVVYFLAHRGQLEPAIRLNRVVFHRLPQRNSRWYQALIGDEMNRHWQALPAEQGAEIEASASQHTPFSILPEVLALLEAA
jgi:DNA-binding SARP family transcriptional activator/predicted ATPase